MDVQAASDRTLDRVNVVNVMRYSCFLGLFASLGINRLYRLSVSPVRRREQEGGLAALRSSKAHLKLKHAPFGGIAI